ncbi:MAG TPA: hypothetical protein PLN91_01980 [Rhodanobacteraceae bacterium]|nr:hypothetical protein [Rhodanobacteraceae bacterium]
MRLALILAGLLLIGLGVAAVAGKLEFTRQKEVLRIGDLSAKVTQERSVPGWAGGVGIGFGAGLVLLGLLRKR